MKLYKQFFICFMPILALPSCKTGNSKSMTHDTSPASPSRVISIKSQLQEFSEAASQFKRDFSDIIDAGGPRALTYELLDKVYDQVQSLKTIIEQLQNRISISPSGVEETSVWQVSNQERTELIAILDQLSATALTGLSTSIDTYVGKLRNDIAEYTDYRAVQQNINAVMTAFASSLAIINKWAEEGQQQDTDSDSDTETDTEPDPASAALVDVHCLDFVRQQIVGANIAVDQMEISINREERKILRNRAGFWRNQQEICDLIVNFITTQEHLINESQMVIRGTIQAVPFEWTNPVTEISCRPIEVYCGSCLSGYKSCYKKDCRGDRISQSEFKEPCAVISCSNCAGERCYGPYPPFPDTDDREIGYRACVDVIQTLSGREVSRERKCSSCDYRLRNEPTNCRVIESGNCP